jgi:hypothetical protein
MEAVDLLVLTIAIVHDQVEETAAQEEEEILVPVPAQAAITEEAEAILREEVLLQ